MTPQEASTLLIGLMLWTLFGAFILWMASVVFDGFDEEDYILLVPIVLASLPAAILVVIYFVLGLFYRRIAEVLQIVARINRARAEIPENPAENV